MRKFYFKSLCLIYFYSRETDSLDDGTGDGRRGRQRQEIEIHRCCQKDLVDAVPASTVVPLFSLMGIVTIDKRPLINGQGLRIERMLTSSP
jgi:hypothetical protein